MALTTEARADLLDALQPQVADIAEDLRRRLVSPGTPAERTARQAAKRLYEEEAVGDAFDVWLDLLGHRAAVMWVLKLVYVRVLEDRGLIRSRVLDRTHQSLFERMAPSLGETAFLRWVFVDLAQSEGGLPELFSPQPAEVLAPTDAHSRTLLALFRDHDLDTGDLRFDFAGERFDGQLLGDLYQELDPVVKARFALLQTPAFVRAFMLDRTLGEALDQWPADRVRVIDPACGSGHFLIDALRRLTDATAALHPEWGRVQVVQSALSRVVGTDLNDYAAALARARLLMTALELSGRDALAAAREFQPQVYWADGLEQVERDAEVLFTQLQLGQAPESVPRASLTPSATRAALRPLLQPGFHVVVANPPYITEKDAARKKYHKEKVGKPKRMRYVSAHRTYSLGSPFTERCFQLAIDGGQVGIINSNSFAKREFGVPLVQDVLAKKDLRLVVDTSGAYIPGHGTPTILIFGRNQQPDGELFTVVLGKRGEPSTPANPSQGKVWSSILQGWSEVGFDSDFVSTEAVKREVFASHPWSLRGGGALALQDRVENAGSTTIVEHTESMGLDTITRAADLVEQELDVFRRAGVESAITVPYCLGDTVRSWSMATSRSVILPYDSSFDLIDIEQFPGARAFLWPHRYWLSQRFVSGGTRLSDVGMRYYEIPQFPAHKHKTKLTIALAFIHTHNDFVLDRGGKVFKQSAPIIKLPSTATVDDHLALLGPLNSSTACFWMKQVSFATGGDKVGAGGRRSKEQWHKCYQFDTTKLARFPLPPNREATLPWAHALDHLAHTRVADTVAATLADASCDSPPALRGRLAARRARDLLRLRQMVGLQEELDWLCYRLYGVVDADLPVLLPESTPPLTPGWRPFELDLATTDRAARDALARGETPDDLPTEWFSRHGWEPCTQLPADVDPTWAALVHRRRAATAESAHLRLLEAPVHKRRWYHPSFDKDEQGALRGFLLTRLEEALAACGTPQTPRALARTLTGDTRFGAAAVVLTGAETPDLEALCAELMAGDAVAAHPLHRYANKGLVKRRAWEQTWALQEREDRGETVTIKVPPKYTGADFLGSVAYPLRGKLDVPKERFVAHTEVPTALGQRRGGVDALYAWAGWTRAERIDRLMGLLEELDDEGVAAPERTALFDLLFRYVGELARTEPKKAADLQADLRYDAGGVPTTEQLANWLKTHPARGSWA